MTRSQKRKGKQISLASGGINSYLWALKLYISDVQQEYEGNFYCGDKKPIKSKLIRLVSGSEEAYLWNLIIYVTAKKQPNWLGNFTTINETQKYRHRRRSLDNRWAGRTFPRRWKEQFEIHHDWNGGETCYFLTPEEHHALHNPEGGGSA